MRARLTQSNLLPRIPRLIYLAQTGTTGNVNGVAQLLLAPAADSEGVAVFLPQRLRFATIQKVVQAQTQL